MIKFRTIGGAGKTTYLRQMEIINCMVNYADPVIAATYTETVFLNIYQVITGWNVPRKAAIIAV